MNNLILINEKDEVIGYTDKENAHKYGLKHKAFSIFLYDREQDMLLIQKRSVCKYHSGGLWSNTCCSHFYQGEEEAVSLQRCISDELGIVALKDNKKRIGSFSYYSNYGELKEFELDSVYLWFVNGNEISLSSFCPEEIEDLRWIRREALKEWYCRNPLEFTSWFAQVFQTVCSYLEKNKNQ